MTLSKSICTTLLLLVLAGCSPVAQPLIGETPELWGTSADGLQMSIIAVPVALRSEQRQEFYAAFRNTGPQDFFLNLGMTLANGRNHYPTAIQLIITDTDGHSRELRHNLPAVGGRVDDYAVGLQVGSIHIVKVNLDQFWCPETNEFELDLPKGTYQIAALFKGTGALHKNTGQLWTAWNFWEGVARSNVLQFEISK